MSIPIPQSLPLMVGLVGEKAAVVERILKGQTDLKTNLIELGKFWKVKVWFNKEIEIRIQSRWVKGEDGSRYYNRIKRTNVHVFNYICNANGQPDRILYGTSRKCRTGYDFPSLELVTRYEPVIQTDKPADEFRSFEHFAAKFDRRFITDDQIKDLWNSKSAQHGGRYCPSDFHRIGPQGKQVLSNFLRLFADVNTEGKCYLERECDGRKYKFLTERYCSHHNLGRDISISHTLGQPLVHYASEYSGCGNGRYGLLANKNEFLWLEDD